MGKKRFRKQSKNTNIGPFLLIGAGVLVILAVALVLLSRSTPNAATEQAGSPNVPAPNVERVSLEDSKAAFDNQEAVFLDVRDADSYNAAHVPGAVNIPLGVLEARANTLDPNQWIITYCT